MKTPIYATPAVKGLSHGTYYQQVINPYSAGDRSEHLEIYNLLFK